MACLFTNFSFTNSHGTFQLAVLILIHVFTSLASPPNIIFILADDLGWDDVSFHGAEFPTPNIDRLALDGVILNNYYVQPMCTPTRGAILTGKYPIHTGLQHYVIAGSQPYGLPLTEITLAQHLQTLGYVTRAIGKIIIILSCLNVDFYYLLFKKIISSSYRGTKNTLWQGGVRGVGFVHSPLLKKKSYVNNNLMHAVDWMPTLLGLAKGDLTKLDNIDGFDQWETISENAESERKEVLLNIDPIMQHESLIIAQYKIIFGNISDGKNDGWYPPSGTNILSANSSNSSLNYEKNNESNIKFISSLNIQDMTQTEVKNLIDILDFINKRLRNNLTMNDVLIDLLPTINEMMNAPQIFFSSVHNKEEMATKKKAEVNSLDLVVNCGIRPTNASTNCQPLKAPCLFDIENDPCEYNNIADHLPVIVEVLTQRLRMYESTMIPPANKPIDPKGDPSLHGGVWGPWLLISDSVRREHFL
uniref:Sulfatase N-terminal domain-containing protein n=1 Tax=Biomphalaria glabrata TaxID=6526 RepID=A0A2C9JWC7_BIOGL